MCVLRSSSSTFTNSVVCSLTAPAFVNLRCNGGFPARYSRLPRCRLRIVFAEYRKEGCYDPDKCGGEGGIQITHLKIIVKAFEPAVERP